MMFAEVIERLKRNLHSVQDDIELACQRCGRKAESVKLIGVTKYVDAKIMRCLYEAGCNAIGENRPDAMRAKVDLLNDLKLEWHFIGHLQRNKIKWVLPTAHWIHSIDSLRLLEAVNAAAESQNCVVNCLLEVNISGETQKHGLKFADVPSALAQMHSFTNIRLSGLMGMGGLDCDEVETRRQFESLRDLSDSLKIEATDMHPLNEISMGMSHDFVWAIESGATMIRVGSRLFEGIEERT